MAAPGGRRGRWGVALRSTWFKVGAAVVAAGALVAGAFVAGGYDVTQTKVDDSSVWALHGGSSGDQYARVDTALGQLDTVKDVGSPSDVVQANGRVLLYSQSNTKVASVDLAQPSDYASNSADLADTPDGTATVVHTGDYVGYLSSTGAVRASRVEDGTKSAQPVMAPGSTKRAFSADAIAIGTDGVLYAYSHTTRTVVRYDVKTGKTLGADAVSGGPDRPGASITAVGDTWALLAPGGGSLWLRGRGAEIGTGLSGKPMLQQPSAKKSVVVVASANALTSFDLNDGRRSRVTGEVSGTPAAPVWLGTKLYAAWVGSTTGTLWVGGEKLSGVVRGSAATLEYNLTQDGVKPLQSPVPVFRGNGSSLILNDTTSGWVWSVPSGKIVQGSQNWSLTEHHTETVQDKTTQTQRQTDPKPPVAKDDSFGVRAGSLASLPVMLNDSDPNGDVISIVPTSLTGLDPHFGVASVSNSAQSVTVQVAPGASGTVSFHYKVTDGTPGAAGESPAATVKLTVSPAGQNHAPQWCSDHDPTCLYTWPSAPQVQVAPGGSVSVPVLRGWVDPDGDPMFASVGPTYRGAVGSTVSVSPDGTAVFQAAPTARSGQTVTIPIVISDVYGATAEKDLTVAITGQPKLTVENFGLMTAAGVPLTVDPSSHVRNTKGTPQIASATLASSGAGDADAGSATSSAGATVTVDSSQSTFDFVAKQPGSYPVTMTIVDSATKSTATATVRITVVSADQPLLSTTPVTVFVRPQTDTSVDVFSAVQNPTGRVLLLSAPKPKPAVGASLDVDVVGQSQLRVRGTTQSGNAGLLGTVDYTVSDGTGAQDMTITGVATVYLLPPAAVAAPVAVDDSVTVRAGAQVDIPVLANDVGSNGNIVELDPSSIQDPSGEGLAFASGQVLRFLAPDTSPGSKPITLRYAAYSAGNPAAKSEATVSVTVLDKDGDRPPQPQTLTGRVTAGASVRIPFDPYGVDPDGDMVTLDRIMTQPQSGTAQLSSDGTAIVFTALANSQGQQSFTYRVRDSQGETGTATVMVGVLNAQTDPAPVTFSDYVQVQAGAGNQVVVQPTANDVDPTGGQLKLVSVTPDAQPGTAEYKRLQQYIKSQNSSQVVITSTPLPRTLTYIYKVQNAQGDSSSGLIVVGVVRGHVPDYPVAVDTVVDAQNLSRLAGGIDVVQGKVSWGAGDVGGLKLSLYKKMSGVSVSGDSIKVAHVPSAGMLVPFKLTGPDFTGHTATTYGFLRIPSLDNVILALKADVKPFEVPEGGSRKVDLGDIVSVPPGQVLSAKDGSVKTTRARAHASCSIDSANQLTYDAGDGAPWTDACLVPVRLSTQSSYTVIAVPFQVIPKQPLPQLHPASLTSSPGQPAVKYDLTQMATWLGHDDLSTLRFQVNYGGQLFTVKQSGQTVSVLAKDTDQPGLEDVAHVSIIGHGGVGTTADITLKVGPAPSTLPQGGSKALSCSEAQGTSCSTTVVGLPDEVNAYSGTPLKVISVGASATGCPGVTFSVTGGDSITAHWSDNAAGGTCTVPFGVRDAQGRSSAGSGSGTLSFDLKGYPSAPASVAQVAYTGSSVTLAVTPGAAASSYPGISGFKVYLDGKASVSCGTDGACPPIAGLANGDKHTFQVKSVNSVGESRAGVQTQGWAFAQPTISGVTATPVYQPGVTSDTTGAFKVTIPNRDSTAAKYTIEWSGNTTTVDAGSSPTLLSAAAGQATNVSVTPVSEFTPPPGDEVGATADSTTVTPAGSPLLDVWGGSLTPSGNDSLVVSPQASGHENGSSKPDAYLYIAVPAGNDVDCSNSGSDAGITTSGLPSDAGTSTSTTISGLHQFHSYDVYVCYTNEYGIAKQHLGTQTVWNQPGAPAGWQYSITDKSNGASLPDYEFDGSAPTGGTTPDNYVTQFADTTQGYTQNYGYPTGLWGKDPGIQARNCGSGFLGLCTAPSSVNPSGAPYQLQATGVTATCQTAPSAGDPSVNQVTATVTMQGQGIGQASIAITSYTYVDPASKATVAAQGDGDDSVTAPAGATNVTVTQYKITLPAGFSSPPAGSRGLTNDSSCN